MRLSRIALAVCASALAGCSEDLIVGLGAGGAVGWSVPRDMGDPGRLAGVDVYVTPVVPTFGLTVHGLGHDDPLVTGYVGWDLGAFIGFMGGTPWPIIKPMVGFWAWGDAPEGRGFMAGFRTGIGFPLDGHGSFSDPDNIVSLEYGWHTLLGASGDSAARYRSWRVAFIHIW